MQGVLLEGASLSLTGDCRVVPWSSGSLLSVHAQISSPFVAVSGWGSEARSRIRPVRTVTKEATEIILTIDGGQPRTFELAASPHAHAHAHAHPRFVRARDLFAAPHSMEKNPWWQNVSGGVSWSGRCTSHPVRSDPPMAGTQTTAAGTRARPHPPMQLCTTNARPAPPPPEGLGAFPHLEGPQGHQARRRR